MNWKRLDRFSKQLLRGDYDGIASPSVEKAPDKICQV